MNNNCKLKSESRGDQFQITNVRLQIYSFVSLTFNIYHLSATADLSFKIEESASWETRIPHQIILPFEGIESLFEAFIIIVISNAAIRNCPPLQSQVNLWSERARTGI